MGPGDFRKEAERLYGEMLEAGHGDAVTLLASALWREHAIGHDCGLADGATVGAEGVAAAILQIIRTKEKHGTMSGVCEEAATATHRMMQALSIFERNSEDAAEMQDIIREITKIKRLRPGSKAHIWVCDMCGKIYNWPHGSGRIPPCDSPLCAHIANIFKKKETPDAQVTT